MIPKIKKKKMREINSYDVRFFFDWERSNDDDDDDGFWKVFDLEGFLREWDGVETWSSVEFGGGIIIFVVVKEDFFSARMGDLEEEEEEEEEDNDEEDERLFLLEECFDFSRFEEEIWADDRFLEKDFSGYGLDTCLREEEEDRSNRIKEVVKALLLRWYSLLSSWAKTFRSE